MIHEDTNFTSKNIKKHHCEFCDFGCSKLGDFNRHKSTLKHKKEEERYKMIQNDTTKTSNYITRYVCDCGKEYRHHSGLWRHKKICEFVEKESKPEYSFDKLHETMFDKDLIMMLVKQNTELLEVLKNGTNNTVISNNHSNNKTFNLQVFLNETCKDAMNIMDFVNSIQLQLSDLESVGKLGFVEGISNIITMNLKALDVTQRPVHCTDNKRETIYIKDDNKWEKEDEQKIKLRKAIKRVATKNMCLIHKFKEAHPDCSKASSRFSDQYNKIVVEACGGSGDNDLEKEDKIIRNIAKNVTIDKKVIT
jgi:hypothetical protein